MFAARLRELGWTEGENLLIDYRYGNGETASMAPVAKELIDLHPDALLAITALSAVTLRQYTLTIPTVFVQIGDPVALGLVTSLARPVGNITGFTSFNFEIGGKWISDAQGHRAELDMGSDFFRAGKSVIDTICIRDRNGDG